MLRDVLKKNYIFCHMIPKSENWQNSIAGSVMRQWSEEATFGVHRSIHHHLTPMLLTSHTYHSLITVVLIAQIRHENLEIPLGMHGISKYLRNNLASSGSASGGQNLGRELSKNVVPQSPPFKTTILSRGIYHCCLKISCYSEKIQGLPWGCQPY